MKEAKEIIKFDTPEALKHNFHIRIKTPKSFMAIRRLFGMELYNIVELKTWNGGLHIKGNSIGAAQSIIEVLK